jgi:hypothetical protein
MAARRFTVEPPGHGDAAIWPELYRAYAACYREAVTGAQLDLLWSWIADPRHDLKALLVRDKGGKAVGLAHYRPTCGPWLLPSPATSMTCSSPRPHVARAPWMSFWMP